MNPAYFKARLRVETPPKSGIPEKFAVITACNPEGKVISDEENAARTEALRASLVEREMRHFPVNGYDPDSGHGEPGFGVACDAATGIELGREWRQEAIFRVVNGEVALVSCETPDEEYPLRSWAEMVDHA